MKLKLNACPKCNSNKVYIDGGEIIPILGIKHLDTYVYCEQCGHKGKVGHTNTSAIAYWNSEIIKETL